MTFIPDPFPLNIEDKQDSWEKLQLLAASDPSFTSGAEEFNKILKALKFLYENVGGMPFTGIPPVKTFQTKAELLAVDPVPEENTPAKVANDPTAANNGFYSVSEGAWVFDAPLNAGEIIENEIRSVTGDKIFTAVKSVQNDSASFFNVFPDNTFEDSLWNKISGSGDVTNVDYNGKRAVRINNCIADIKIDFSEYVNKSKKWSFAVFVESLTLGSTNARFIAQCLNSGNGLEGDRFNLFQSTDLSGKYIFSDNYAFDPDGVKFQIYVDATGDDIYLSNFFIGNAPYAKFIPQDKALIEANKNASEIESTNLKLIQRNLLNAIPNNFFRKGLEGWEVVPDGTNGFVSTITLENDVANPFNSIVRRTVGGSVSSSSNWTGIALEIADNFLVGDTIVFRGLFKKSLGTDTPHIELRAKNEALSNLLTVTSDDYTENTTDWIETGDLKITLPSDTFWIFVFIRDFSEDEFIDITGWTLTKEQTELSGVYIENNLVETSSVDDGRYSYFVSKTGDDNDEGSSSSPFLTIQKALNSSVGKESVKIIISEGDYRETLNFSSFRDENIELIAKETDVVRVLGSENITGFTKTSGYTNIYEADFNGSIIDYPNAMGKTIFEDGRPSKDILSAEFNPLQRGLTKRLPYTEIKEQEFDTNLSTTLGLLDNNEGRFYYNEFNDKIYLHTSDSDNPSTNGFLYEISERATTFASSALTDCNYRFTNIQFFYSNVSGFDLRFARSVYRNRCMAFGNNGNGFRDDVTAVTSYKDEAGGNSNDGINGHYDLISGFASTSLRSGFSSSYYFDVWLHDNYDDGISFHERGDFQIHGGLTEYNGDRGCVPASGSNLMAYNVLARKNGFNVGVISNTFGEGFSIVNPAVDGRSGTYAMLFNCISEDNNKGFAVRDSENNKMTLVDCISRNSTTVELDADDGVIVSKNTKATAGNLFKQTSGTGQIIIENDTLVI